MKLSYEKLMHSFFADYSRKRQAAVIIQSKYKSLTQRRVFVRYRRAVITIQSYVRGMFAREVSSIIRCSLLLS